MTPSIKPNPLSVPVTLQTTQPTQRKSPAGSRRDSTALALLGAMLLVLAMTMGVSMTAAASGGFQDIVRTVKAAFGIEDALVTEQQRQASIVAVLERRLHTVTTEVGSLTSRALSTRYQDAAVSDRFTTLETDISALTAEIRALRAPRIEVTAGAPAAQVDFLEATLVEVGSGVVTLRSSFDEFAQSTRKDIADLAQLQRKTIADITSRVDRIEQLVTTRDLTGSIRTTVRKKKVRIRRAAPVARGNGEMAPLYLQASPLLSAPAYPQ